jgi:MFS family permease
MALNVGLFVLGVGVRGVFASPTAILFGKRPIYLTSRIILALSSILCAVAPVFMLFLLGRWPKKYDGVFEPGFPLAMAPLIALSTTINIIRFGWSAYIQGQWMVPTFFFSIVSFGCNLGSITAITYCVDSYKEFAAETLVISNFSKSMS